MIIEKPSFNKIGKKLQILMLKFALGAIIGFFAAAGIIALLSVFLEESMARNVSIWTFSIMFITMCLIVGCGVFSVKIMNILIKKRKK